MIKKTALLALFWAATSLAANAQDGFRPLFNGNDLTGWDGNPELWSVEDGVISGRTTDPKQLKYNQFLIWRGGVLKNFELRVTAKVTGNNSGIQYRSRENEPRKWSISGYQCDMIGATPLTAMLYEEGGRGVVAQNGQSVVVDPQGKRWLTEKRQPVQADVAEWREYTVIANGNHLIHKIDGKVTMELFDHEEAKRSLEGVLAFQLHGGPAMNVQIKDVRLKELPDGGVVAFDQAKLPEGAQEIGKKKPAPAPAKKVSNAKGKADGAKWIWHAKPASSPSSRLRKEFELGEGDYQEAVLHATCDNGAKIHINGKLVATNADWMKPTRIDVGKHLRPGKNELRAEASNSGGIGGFIASLVLKNKAGQEVKIQSDASWQGAAPNSETWKPAAVLATYGDAPWGRIFEGKPATQPSVAAPAETTAANKIEVPDGFQVEKLYNVPKGEQGSWVALTIDHKGRLLAGDQYGSIYRMSVPAVGTTELLQPEKLDIDLGKAHGLLAAFDSLYVMVNEDGANNGLYRVTDIDGDDQYDQVTLLHKIRGGGEHGLHSMAVSPDGKRIFFNCGNGTQLPEGLEKTRSARTWGEDHVLPRLWDGNGLQRGYTGPGGYICSMNPDGSDLELFSHGFRNQFDIAFDLGGQLFTYDADMEWDIGTPWYRYTRVNHCVSGGDYGWHTGSAKWPDYYPDNLPTTIDIGPGSPTGVASGKGAKFPAKYQRAVFINDWTYGTMWAVHLRPEGGSYIAEKEDFLHAKPLPLTDVVIHPLDGAMYFAVGGRRTQSGVYRVTYAGEESTEPVEALPLGQGFQTRAEVERFHSADADPETVLAKAWPLLDHADRHVRYAARIAIERVPVELWKEQALGETRPRAVVEAAIALARSSGTVDLVQDWPHAKTSSAPLADVTPEDAELQGQLLEALARLDLGQLDTGHLLATLRAYQIALTRFGIPAAEARGRMAQTLEAVFPAADPYVNRELVQLLVAVDSPRVVSQTLALMATAADDFQEVASDAVLNRNDSYARAARAAAGSRPNAQQIAYMTALRNASAGWSPEHRKTYFSWFPRARGWKGGNSFKNFIENIRTEAIANIAPESELSDLEALSSRIESVAIPNYVAPKGPGKAYTLDETVQLAQNGLTGRNFTNGQNMYSSVTCAICHRFSGEGGSIGPDLTGTGNRYTLRDLMENIIDPSRVISDQYGSHQITKKDGSIVVGRIVVEENGKVFVVTNPFAPNDQVAIDEAEIAKKEARQVSMMPPGLINALNEEELLDLVAYLISGGDAEHEMFAK